MCDRTVAWFNNRPRTPPRPYGKTMVRPSPETGMPLPRQDAVQLVERDGSRLDLRDAVRPERRQAGGFGGCNKAIVRRARSDEGPELVVERQQLEDADAAVIAAAAVVAADRAEERGIQVCTPGVLQHVRRRLVPLAAVETEPSREALPEDSDE